MPPWLAQLFLDPTLRRQVLRRGVLWTLVVVAVLGTGVYFSRRERLEVALGRARDSFHKDVATRLWAAQRGGVYVPLDARTPADPYLKELPNREITTTEGKVYTLVNPASLTRAIHELAQAEYGIQSHIASLRPIRPENAADGWERKALETLRSGAREYWEELPQAGGPQLRFIGALVYAEGCRGCHATEGYRIGDVRGGISVTVPLNQGSGLIGGVHDLTTFLGVGGLWLIGLGVILTAGRGAVIQLQDRQRSQDTLLRSEANMKAILASAAAGILAIDNQRKILHFNSRFMEIWQIPRELAEAGDDQALLECAFGRLADPAAFLAKVEALYDSDQSDTDILEFTDGRSIERFSTPMLLADRIMGRVWSFRDITERQRAEANLRESEQRFRQAIEEAPFPIMLHAEDGEVIALSRAWTELSGYSHSDIPTISAWTEKGHSGEPARIVQKIQDLHERGTGMAGGEYAITCKDGSQRLWDFNSVSLGRLSDKRRIAVSMAADVTERKQAEEARHSLEVQLQQAQKMESLGSLAGGVAHDMNNVLGAILGLASANLRTQALDSKAHQAFATIIKAAERGGKMVKSLLSFARQSPVEERELDLNGILLEEVHLLERTTLSKVCLELDLAPDLRPIRGDAGALTHAIMNLCVNAVDAMPESGTLTLRTRNIDEEWIEVMVEDTGTGMAKAILDRALDPFFTTKEEGKGTGLGLSLVYSTVKAHQGQLELQSQPGRGTRVRMRFPVCEPLGADPEFATGTTLDLAHGSLSVLLVDDDELIQSSMLAILETLGHSATAVSCGEAALEQLEAGLKPDIVILDMNMPGLGGLGTLPRLRALHPDLPVLLATGRADQTALDLVASHPGTMLLSKPFSIGELQQNLEQLARP